MKFLSSFTRDGRRVDVEFVSYYDWNYRIDPVYCRQFDEKNRRGRNAPTLWCEKRYPHQTYYSIPRTQKRVAHYKNNGHFLLRKFTTAFPRFFEKKSLDYTAHDLWATSPHVDISRSRRLSYVRIKHVYAGERNVCQQYLVRQSVFSHLLRYRFEERRGITEWLTGYRAVVSG